MTSAFDVAGNIIKNLAKPYTTLSNNLLCGVKEQFQSLISISFSRYSVVVSQGLEDAYFRNGSLGYDHKSGFLRHSGMCQKSSGSTVPGKKYSTASLIQGRLKFSANENFIKLWKLKNYKNKYSGLIDSIGNSSTLIAAYEVLKFKSGNNTAEAQKNKTLNEISKKWFEIVALKIQKGSFQFKSVRRIRNPKLYKSGLNPLIINDYKDKIVMQAMRMVLEQIYEPDFLQTSHGFRPLKGCHTALKQIKMNWIGISWFLKLDIRKCYYNIDRHRLVSILRKKIDDQRFIDLIHKLFNAGIIGLGSKEEILQENILSPILSNIYLHRLDIEVQKIQEEYESGKKRRMSSEYSRKTRIIITKDFSGLPIERRATIMSKKRRKARKMGLTRRDWNDPSFVRIRYIRYLDGFLLGISGPKSLVETIKKRLTNFVKSDLKLELVGGEITHIASGKINFLGMEISALPHSKFSRRFGKALEKKKRIKNRLSLFRSIREARLGKVVQKALKKVLRGKCFLDVKDLKDKFQAIKKEVLLNEEFSRSSINVFKVFIKSLTKSNIFMPESIKKISAELEMEIQIWENSLASVVMDDSKSHYNNLKGCNEAVSLQISAPLRAILEKFRSKGLISKSNRPIGLNQMYTQSDADIIKWFNVVGRGYLNYYRCCNNFYKVKNYVNYMVRWSAIHTLSRKHKLSSRKVIKKWSKDLVIMDSDNYIIAQFISNTDIKSMGRKFLLNVDKDADLRVLGSKK
jgi:retron-type reverse transcriptase